MNIPVLQGTIARRLLVNFRADPAVIQSKLPSPFRPKLHQGHAIVGVCLIRLEHIRPKSSLLPFGIASENAAHRIAVEWDDAEGNLQEGVFIPRRDTGSLLNHLTGGRIFPGQHQLADFHVTATANDIDFKMCAHDRKVEVRVKGRIGTDFPESSCFASVADASAFFERGSLGYSVRAGTPSLDGLVLKTKTWNVEMLDTSEAYSSYYANEEEFPKGSIVYDHTLLMRNIEHEWHAASELHSGEPPAKIAGSSAAPDVSPEESIDVLYDEFCRTFCFQPGVNFMDYLRDQGITRMIAWLNPQTPCALPKAFIRLAVDATRKGNKFWEISGPIAMRYEGAWDHGGLPPQESLDAVSVLAQILRKPFKLYYTEHEGGAIMVKEFHP